MSVYEAILSRRSIRRFQQKPIELELLKKFINAARLAPSDKLDLNTLLLVKVSSNFALCNLLINDSRN